MAQSRSFKLRQADNRPNYYDGALPEIDRKRATAVLVRQSKTGADTAQAESRETQLGCKTMAGCSIATTSRMYGCMMKAPEYPGKNALTSERYSTVFIRTCTRGIVGTVILSREDRLFRNKHMDQVGAFTRLAEEKRIKVMVPPISSASTEERTRVYDFTIYRDLCAFQDKMREAYGYIEGHVKYMHLCQQDKADKGGYDGRALPPGLAVKGKKQDQVIVIPEIPEEDKERYMFKTTLRLIPGVGYKPIDPQTIRDWLTNEMLIGWWQPDEDKPDTIIDNHPAVLDYALFAEG